MARRQRVEANDGLVVGHLAFAVLARRSDDVTGIDPKGCGWGSETGK